MGIKVKNLITTVAVVSFVIIILPLLIMGLYSHPYSDDFWYGAVVRTALNNGGSVWDALSAAIKQTGVVYETWQGSYAAVFLMALHPGIWSSNASSYWLGPIIMLGILICGVYLLLWMMLSRLGAGIRTKILIPLAPITIMLQLMPSTGEGIYWFNGACYYTLFFGILCFQAACYMRITDMSRNKITVPLVFGAILGTLVGAGSLPIGLLACEIGLAFLVWAFIKRLPKSTRIAICIILAVTLVGFLINVLSPGNTIRQLKQNSDLAVYHGVNPVIAIAGSIYSAALFSIKWLSPALLGALLLSSTIIWKYVSQSGFGFRFPFLVTACSFVLLGSMFAPNTYATGAFPPMRYLNVVWFTFVLLTTINWHYWLGWLSQRITFEANAFTHKGLVFGIAIAVCIIAAGYVPLSSSAQCTWSIASGEASLYRDEWEDILEQIDESDLQEVTILGNSIVPYPFVHSRDAKFTSTDFFFSMGVESKRVYVAEYFGKKDLIIVMNPTYTEPSSFYDRLRERAYTTP